MKGNLRQNYMNDNRLLKSIIRGFGLIIVRKITVSSVISLHQ